MVSDFFHLRNFLNATSDEAIFLVSAYFNGPSEAEHLSNTLHWKCQRPLRALCAMMNESGKGYTKRGTKARRV
jgi:hypothetical protein